MERKRFTKEEVLKEDYIQMKKRLTQPVSLP